MKKAFEFRFQNELFSLMYQKKIFTNKYSYLLIMKAVFGNSFIFKYIAELMKDQSSRDRLSVNRTYIENSPIERLAKTNLEK
jgi:hypothetical protein